MDTNSKYKVMWANSSAELGVGVSLMLDNGYVCSGSLIVEVIKGQVLYMQPMVKMYTPPSPKDEFGWLHVAEYPLIEEQGPFSYMTKYCDQYPLMLVAVPYRDNSTDDPLKTRWWIRKATIHEGQICLFADEDLTDEDPGWEVSDISYWKPITEPPETYKLNA